MAELGYIKGIGIWYRTEINTIPKKDTLQPIFEAFTNSLESTTTLKEREENPDKGLIAITVQLSKSVLSGKDDVYNFEKIIIEDTGIGFENKEFERFINLRDNRKGFSNKGTGRVQFLHAFGYTVFNSIFKDVNSTTGFKQRIITLSKNDAFLNQNSIIRLDKEEEIEATACHTSVTFENILQENDEKFYRTISAEEIKQELIRHYLAGFCEKRDNLPRIVIKTTVNDIIDELEIIPEDIPKFEFDEPIEVHYSKVESGKLVILDRKEEFKIKTFKQPKAELEKNSLKLVSKGEIAKEIKLDHLLPNDIIGGNRYLFLLSGNYIDERDSDDRGNIKILNKKEFRKLNSDDPTLMSAEEVLLDDIEEKTNNKILTLYKEIEEKSKEREKSIEVLRQMFLLNPVTIDTLRNKINIDDSDDTILRKVYEADAKILAAKDAEIKKQIQELDKQIISKDDKSQEELTTRVNELVKTIPLQNRTALTQYVARRKLVLDLFSKILNKEIEKLKNGGRIDEDLLHNIIFQQSSDKPEDSDLWLINEEFIYFKGFSEQYLNKIEINGKRIFDKTFSKEEERYLNSLGEKRLTKRPDILLFPSEGKCIIIEFKAPDVNVADHLTQIDFYANLILNYTIDEVQISTFYGYLIGESIEDRDVRGRVSRFEHSYHLDYWFRPSETVQSFSKRASGSLYTEVIKYTTLLKRADLRNKIFIDKLEGKK